MLNESHKNRMQFLAGILLEVDNETKTKLLHKSGERVPFSPDMMSQAIKQGREIGILYKSEGMPVQKYRIVRPVVLGKNSKGNQVIRALHVIGQSEKRAKQTGQRSAEAENEWRLFRADRIKGMWFTDRFFSNDIKNYNPNDEQIASIDVSYKPSIAKTYQNNLTTKEVPDSEDEESNVDTNKMQQDEPNIPKKDPVKTKEEPGEDPSEKTPEYNDYEDSEDDVPSDQFEPSDEEIESDPEEGDIEIVDDEDEESDLEDDEIEIVDDEDEEEEN